MNELDYTNSTHVPDPELIPAIRAAISDWSVGHLVVRVRYSRGADFSGTCFYNDGRIYVNLGRHVRYPYLLRTSIGRGRQVGRVWRKPLYALRLPTALELVMFVFMHELYHLLVKRARRNPRQKESMCDRFATRWLVDRCGVEVVDGRGQVVPRQAWDFQDVEGFVARARRRSKRSAMAG